MAKDTDSSRLKFLLELVNCEDYRSKLTDVRNVGAAQLRDDSCEGLLSRSYVECSKEISKFIISGAGKELLNKDVENLPITDKEVSVLKACTKKVTPGQLGKKVPPNERQELLWNLSDRGLIEISETKVIDVWLSAQGRRFLLEEFSPKGGWTLSANKVGYYVKFLRENVNRQQPQQSVSDQPSAPQRLLNRVIDAIPIGSQNDKPNAQAVLQQIKQLDQQVGNKNYLPIYHLRKALQSSLTRDELDNILYSLQREGRIDLDSLHDQGNYTSDQVSAGIRQDNGGYLFFVSVL